MFLPVCPVYVQTGMPAEKALLHEAALINFKLVPQVPVQLGDS